MIGSRVYAEPLDEYELLGRLVSVSLYVSVTVWLFYAALEPHVRRFWSQLLIGWTRALTGRLRDPLVGIALIFSVLLRFGLLSLIITIYTFLAIEAFPLTTNFSRPYAGASFLVAAAIAGLSIAGFYASRGDEPVFGRPLLD